MSRGGSRATMRITPSIPGERQGMRISPQLYSLIASWLTYSIPMYGTSRMIAAEKVSIYEKYSKKSLGTSLEKGRTSCEIFGSIYFDKIS
ncbi:hypothetical protein O3M35_009653 [Rhynocoris fuscipes]|uniref:Uncharacterized protein n=1 Tax=Rhynocoris fuscipes TaxID=488301 RepID=A0AAW1D4H7_9HEMI